jgi:hypothetical protein
MLIFDRRPPKAMMYFLFFIFYFLFLCRSICRPKRLDGVPPRALPPTRFRYNIPPNDAADFGLIVVSFD